ncbi:MAG TPA: 2-dehydropantoate 2-reductase, partial [Thermoplasmatales archaeon]|nr:2-dehydropantoate 2-reductase [Thermoplasmatales archaeon]
MRIMVFGAGAIGSLFGGLLSRNNDVTLVGRKAHVEAIRRKGLRLTGEVDDVVYPDAVCDVSEVDEELDLVLITVKAYDTEAAAEAVKRVAGEKTLVLSLQNGL